MMLKKLTLNGVWGVQNEEIYSNFKETIVISKSQEIYLSLKAPSPFLQYKGKGKKLIHMK